MKNEKMYPSPPHSTRMHKLPHLRESEIRNPEIFASGSGILESYLRNPKSWELEFETQLTKSGIPLTIGIWNPIITNKQSGIQ